MSFILQRSLVPSGAFHRFLSTSTLLDHAENYVKWDPNPTTVQAVEMILSSNDNNESSLAPLIEGRLSFGTAGLRAPFGPGYNCMNDLTVIQTAQGLLKYLEESGTGVKKRGIVVGYDHRASKEFTAYDLSSEIFAKITAAVFQSQGVPVFLYDRLVATPLVPFGFEEMDAACGVMVTASHNPKEDTGYKVYWGNGAQIIPPHDKGIADKILENLEPWETYEMGGVSKWEEGARMEELYFDKMKRECFNGRGGEGAPLTYTAMHGVGHEFAKKAFDKFGLTPFVSVVEQVRRGVRSEVRRSMDKQLTLFGRHFDRRRRFRTQRLEQLRFQTQRRERGRSSWR